MNSISSNDGVIWTTTSFHGNAVTLYQEDLEHILEHKEMVGREADIRRAVESPALVREGWDAKSCAFEAPSATNSEGMRVYVKHSRENFIQGGVVGCVTTAYDIQSGRYTTAHVGAVISKDRGGV